MAKSNKLTFYAVKKYLWWINMCQVYEEPLVKMLCNNISSTIFYVVLQTAVEFKYAMLKNVCILFPLLHFLTPRTHIHWMKMNWNNFWLFQHVHIYSFWYCNCHQPSIFQHILIWPPSNTKELNVCLVL